MRDGHDGTWVAHPALVPIARDIFNAGMRQPQPGMLRRPLASSFQPHCSGLGSEAFVSWPSQMVNAANLTLCSAALTCDFVQGACVALAHASWVVCRLQ